MKIFFPTLYARSAERSRQSLLSTPYFLDRPVIFLRKFLTVVMSSASSSSRSAALHDGEKES